MTLSRRGFLSGVAAALAAAALPKVRVERPKPLPDPSIKWAMMLYGMPIIYAPRKFVVVPNEEDICA